MNIFIVYFSGTGGTEKFCLNLKEALAGKGDNADVFPLDLSKVTSLDEKNQAILSSDKLIVAYPVYAYDAPKPVYDWLKSMPNADNVNTYIVSVSGGGEQPNNRTCRNRLIKHLVQKGFNVVYEKMITMPCNYAETAPDVINAMLVKAAELSAKKMADDIQNDVKKRSKKTLAFVQALVSFAFSSIGRVKFGQSLAINENCTECKWCESNCPTQNIKIIDGDIKASNKCAWCMRCVYGCPAKAIESRMFDSAILKNGFSIKKFADAANESDISKIENITSQAQGWVGAEEYLKSVFDI